MSAVTRTEDVLVVGSGIIGCSVAFELARRGATVRVVDDREPAGGATHASAGMLAPFLEAPHEGPLLDLTTRGLDCFESHLTRLAAQTDRPVEYGRSGSLSVATDPAGDFERLAEALRARGLRVEALDATAVRREEPSIAPDVTRGLVIAEHGYVAVHDLMDATVSAAQHLGVLFERLDRVRRIGAEGRLLRADTGSQSRLAGHVVVASGAWASAMQIDGALVPLPVHPVRGQLLQVRGAAPVLRRVTWSDDCYLVPWLDGTVLVGATVEDAGFDERVTVAGVSALLRAASKVIPSLADASFVSARVGLRPGSVDGLPLIGPSSMLPGVVYATGHFRNGILLAPLTAQLVADLILDGRIDPLLSATAPARFGRV